MNEILVINGYEDIVALEESYIQKHTIWGNECASVRAMFKKKTSRKEKNGKLYEYTNWYRETSGGGLESVGKQEPDYKKYYPPEPKPAYSFAFKEYEGHVILEEKYYLENQKLFEECLAFRLEECQNRIHPLYANPDKAIKDSVRKSGVISARSSGNAGQKRDPACIDDGCLGDWDCDSCEHSDECPVMAESNEEDS